MFEDKGLLWIGDRCRVELHSKNVLVSPARQKGYERLIIRILTCPLERYHSIGKLRAYSC